MDLTVLVAQEFGRGSTEWSGSASLRRVYWLGLRKSNSSTGAQESSSETADSRDCQRRAGSHIAVGRNLFLVFDRVTQFLATWTTPPACFNVLVT